jgi:hypothetical protein
MQKVLSLIAIFFFLSVQQVSAHAEGLVPFLTVNGSYPDVHPIQKETIVPKSFSVPEDIAKEKFLVNEEIAFVIDTSVLSRIYPDDVLSTITYEWEMGDGSIKQGTEVKHAYKQIGSKVLTIYAKFEDPNVELPPQPIEVVQLEIVPNKNYILPEPIIVADRKELDIKSHEVNMQNPIRFEAKIKNQPTADIVSYAWDFGEGGTSTEQNPIHTYTTSPEIVSPVLKVTDKNGFAVYTFGLLTNGKNTAGYTFATNTVGAVILGVQSFVVVIGVIWFVWAVRKKKHTKRS